MNLYKEVLNKLKLVLNIEKVEEEHHYIIAGLDIFLDDDYLLIGLEGENTAYVLYEEEDFVYKYDEAINLYNQFEKYILNKKLEGELKINEAPKKKVSKI